MITTSAWAAPESIGNSPSSSEIPAEHPNAGMNGDAVNNMSALMDLMAVQEAEVIGPAAVDRAEAASSLASDHAAEQDWRSIFAGTELGGGIETVDAVVSETADREGGSYQVVLWMEFKNASGDTVMTASANYGIDEAAGPGAVKSLSVDYASSDGAVGGSMTMDLSSGSGIRTVKITERSVSGPVTTDRTFRKNFSAGGQIASFTEKTTVSSPAENGLSRVRSVTDSKGEDGTVISMTAETLKDGSGRVVRTVSSKTRRNSSNVLVESSHETVDQAYWEGTSTLRSTVKTTTVLKAGGLEVATTETTTRDSNGRLLSVVKADQKTRPQNGEGKVVDTVETSTLYTDAGRVRGDMTRTERNETYTASNVKSSERSETVNYHAGAVSSKVSERIEFQSGVMSQKIARTEIHAEGVVSGAVTRYIHGGMTFEVREIPSAGTVQVLDLTSGAPVPVTGVTAADATDPSAFMGFVVRTASPFDADGYDKRTGFHRETGLDRSGYDVQGNRKIFYPAPDQAVLRSHYVKTAETTTFFLINGRKEKMVSVRAGMTTMYRDNEANTRFQEVLNNGIVHTYNASGTVRIRTVYPKEPKQTVSSYEEFFDPSGNIKFSYDAVNGIFREYYDVARSAGASSSHGLKSMINERQGIQTFYRSNGALERRVRVNRRTIDNWWRTVSRS